jgi:LEA14-like dessication related protein
MKKLSLLIILVVLSAAFAGCSKPEMKSVTMHWGEVNSTTTQIISNVYVSNPLPFSIPLSGVNVKIYMNGIEMGTGYSVGKTDISPPGGTIRLVIDLMNSKLVDWWCSHIRNGERTTVKIVSDLQFSILGFKFGIPITKVNEFKTDLLSGIRTKNVDITVDGINVGEVKDLNLRWGDVTHDTTQIIASGTVVNNMPIPLYLRYFEYHIYMNGIDMGRGKITSTKIIKPKSQGRVEFTMLLQNSKIPEWWVTHIRNGEKTTVKIVTGLGMEINGKDVFIGLQSYKYTFHTNILSMH